ncbi:MAG TPA: 2-C-methyl-D-erythritol 2,4-cyclodiphosphate synthase [Candidatus Limnocylindrales bacterium]|nr:2-C-methyl-D-erythritol 2,4-cyclodiphosphate synthase [Candidatus Limnocylindrales bacterium]
MVGKFSFEKFNEEARRCIFMARLAAITEKSKTIALPHLLAGIRKENPGAFRGVNWAKVPLKLAHLSPESLHSASQAANEIPLDAKAKRALLAAPQVAKKFHSEQVTPAHLLAAILAADARLRKQFQKAGLSEVSPKTIARATRSNSAERPRIARSGIGYDLHRLAENRKLMIGGIEVPFEKGSASHSDGDVLCHAICDALLGAACLGDIGTHFPDTDPKWRGVSSLVFLRQVRQFLERKNWKIRHIDAIVVLERPKLGPHFPAMREALAKALAISAEQINLKAKTHEGLGEIGRGEALAAHVIATIES